MSKPLSHRPFAALEPAKPEVTVIRRRTTDPESGLKLVSQIRVPPLPTDPPSTAQLTPDPAESEPESVAAKKTNKRTPESIAKQKATLAKKKRSKKAAPGEKADYVRAHPGVPIPKLVKQAKKEGIRITVAHAYAVRRKATTVTPKPQRKADGPSSNGASISELLETIADAALEIKRRLSQLTL